MRSPTIPVVLLALSACTAPWTPPPVVRISAGASDTVVVNNVRPTTIPVRALDADGRAVAGAPIRYVWPAGDSVMSSTTLTVACDRSGEVAVRAFSGNANARILVLCRPVEHVRLPGPMQFVLGDSALEQPRALPAEAYDADWQRVALVDGQAWVGDSSRAMPAGLTLTPELRGVTITTAFIGDRSATTGVHIYQRVSGFDALDTLLSIRPNQRQLAVPFSIEAGEMRRQRLPPGSWMLSMLPKPESNGLHLRIEGARCEANILNDPGRMGCRAGNEATVTVYREFGSRGGPVATGYLLVRHF